MQTADRHWTTQTHRHWTQITASRQIGLRDDRARSSTHTDAKERKGEREARVDVEGGRKGFTAPKATESGRRQEEDRHRRGLPHAMAVIHKLAQQTGEWRMPSGLARSPRASCPFDVCPQSTSKRITCPFVLSLSLSTQNQFLSNFSLMSLLKLSRLVEQVSLTAFPSRRHNLCLPEIARAIDSLPPARNRSLPGLPCALQPKIIAAQSVSYRANRGRDGRPPPREAALIAHFNLS